MGYVFVEFSFEKRVSKLVAMIVELNLSDGYR